MNERTVRDMGAEEAQNFKQIGSDLWDVLKKMTGLLQALPTLKTCALIRHEVGQLLKLISRAERFLKGEKEPDPM